MGFLGGEEEGEGEGGEGEGNRKGEGEGKGEDEGEGEQKEKGREKEGREEFEIYIHPLPPSLSSSLSLSPPLSLSQKKNQKKTHWKNNNNILLPLHHNSEIIPHLKPAKGLMDQNIHYLRRGDEPRGGGEEVVRRQRTGLDPQCAECEEGFFCGVEIWDLGFG